MVSASAGRNKGRGAGVQGHCATGPAPTPAPRRPRNGAPAAASGLRAARRQSGHADAGKCKPSREAPVSNQAGRGRRASHLDRGWGRGGNTLCLEIRRLSPQLFILSKTVLSPPQQTTGTGPTPGPRRGLCSPLFLSPQLTPRGSGGEG